MREPKRGTYSITPSQFKNHLGWLKAEGFVIEGFGELGLRLMNNDLPQRYVVITFDDGHKSDLQAADLLRQVGARATFFLNKSLSGSGTGFLKERDIRELSALSSIGSHGITHRPLTTMSVEAVRAELSDSKKWLEDVSGVSITALSLPGGFINEQIVDEALRLGYTLCGNSVEWWNTPDSVRGRSVVNRIAIRGSYRMPTFESLARGDLSFLLRRRVRSSVLALPKCLLTQSQIGHLRRRIKIS